MHLSVGSVCRQDKRKIGKTFIVCRRKFFTSGLKSVNLFQLMYAKRSSEIIHVVLESWRHHFILPRRFARSVSVKRITVYPMKTHDFTSLCNFGIASYEHTAFTGGKGFCRIK